ncbi:CvpA family protein [Salisaeta longa]|uniref:CvpA family protein n=1 Tax=Salisaeta longa TaxID=503170 RepID=UPI0003B710F7|nr:CvpA family protein [Salisaeta longa]
MDVGSLTAIDWFIGAVLAIGLARGVQAGAVRQVAGLLSWGLAFLVGAAFMHPVGRAVGDSLNLAAAAEPLVGFVLAFVGALIITYALAHLLEKTLDALKLTIVNRLSGGLFGAAKAALMLSVLFFVLHHVGVPSAEVRARSQLYRPVAHALPTTWNAVAPYLPAAQQLTMSLQDELRDARQSIESLHAPPADTTDAP